VILKVGNNMELKFLGRGSGFNIKEGNTSAYFIDSNELFLIDCGWSAFEKLIKKDLLVNKNKINVMITHTHSDHVGSLESLISYCYYVLNKKVNILISKNVKQKENLINLLNNLGVNNDAYLLIDTEDYTGKYKTFTSINYIKTEHTKLLECFGIAFNTPKGIIFYSGDSKECELVLVFNKNKQKIDKLYLDVTDDQKAGEVHTYIETLKKIVPDNLKDKIYTMHFNSDSCIKRAKELGFNIVEVEN